MKEVKCSKCGLSYPRSKHICPYCHKKRFNVIPLIALILLCGIGYGGYYVYSNDYLPDTVKNFFNAERNDKQSNFNGLKFNFLEATEKEVEEEKEITIYFDIENTTSKEISFASNFITYVDNYVSNDNWINLYSGADKTVTMSNLIPDKKLKQDITLKTNSDWNEIEVYYRPAITDDTETEYLKIFTIHKEDVTIISEPEE